MRAFDDVLRDAALRFGIYVTRARQPPPVLDLLERLWPTYDPSRLARYGDDGDGGYLLPDNLAGVTGCASPGVADSVSFEVAMARVGIPSWLVDASIDELPQQVAGATFIDRFVGSRTEDQLLTLSDLIETMPEGDLVVQLDIEGDEYATLAATPIDVLTRARILVVELHHLYNLFEPVSGPPMAAAIARLLDHFGVAHLHANNMDGELRIAGRVVPRALEVTFVRNDAMIAAQGPVTLPHPLDSPCVPGRPDIVPVFHP